MYDMFDFPKGSMNDEKGQTVYEGCQKKEGFWKCMDFTEMEKRFLCILLVDHSGSTSSFINEINEGLKRFVRITQEQEDADAFDLMVFPFSSDVAELINSPVIDVDPDAIKPLKSGGFTRLDLALETACEKMIAYMHGNKLNFSNQRPCIVIISDGLPTDGRGKYLDAEDRDRLVNICQRIIACKYASIYTFFVGRDKDGADFLKQLASAECAFQIESIGEKIQQMFELLSITAWLD